MDVVHPISEGKLHPDAGTKTLIPSAQGRSRCLNTTLIWALFLVTNDRSTSCCRRLKGSFRGDLRSCFHVKSNCAMLSLWVNLLLKRTEGYASGRNVSSAEFSSVLRAQVRPSRPKFTATFILAVKTQSPCQKFLLLWSDCVSVCSLLSCSLVLGWIGLGRRWQPSQDEDISSPMLCNWFSVPSIQVGTFLCILV